MHEKGDAEIPAEQTDKEERTGRNFQSDSSNEVYKSRLPESYKTAHITRFLMSFI